GRPVAVGPPLGHPAGDASGADARRRAHPVPHGLERGRRAVGGGPVEVVGQRRPGDRPGGGGRRPPGEAPAGLALAAEPGGAGGRVQGGDPADVDVTGRRGGGREGGVDPGGHLGGEPVGGPDRVRQRGARGHPASASTRGPTAAAGQPCRAGQWSQCGPGRVAGASPAASAAASVSARSTRSAAVASTAGRTGSTWVVPSATTVTTAAGDRPSRSATSRA